MKRRDMFKGLLGLFALGAPAIARGKERIVRETITIEKTNVPSGWYWEAYAKGYRECYNDLKSGEYKQHTTIKWTSVEDEFPEETDSANEQFYLLGYDNGRISTVSSCELIWYFNPKNHPNVVVSRWALLPKNSRLLSSYSSGERGANEYAEDGLYKKYVKVLRRRHNQVKRSA